MLREYFIDIISALNKKVLECARLELDEMTISAYKQRLYEACRIANELGVLSWNDVEDAKNGIAL